MSLNVKLHLILLCATLVLLAQPAFAAELSDEDYVTHFFGSSLIFTSPTQVVDANTGAWWADSLPESLRYDGGYIAGMINAKRIQDGTKPLLEPTGYNVAAGSEIAVDGGFEYNIDFIGIRPSEVEMVLQSFGGASEVMPGAKVSFRPLRLRSFTAFSYDLSQPLELNLGAETLAVPSTASISSLRDDVERILLEYYGPNVVFDLYYSQYNNRDGSSGADVNVYAEIPDPNAPPMDYGEPMG